MRDQEKEESATRLLDERNISKKEGAVLREAFEASEEGKEYIKHINRIVWEIPEEIQEIDKFTPLQPHHGPEKMKLVRELEDEKQRLEAQCEQLIERYEQKNKLLTPGTSKQIPNVHRATAKGTTKPDGTLTQAVKGLFYHLLKNGDWDTLKKANIHVFANKMKEFARRGAEKIDTKDMEVLGYLSERIESVKIAGKSITVKTKEYQHPRSGGMFKPEKATDYNKQAIEKRLKPLREKHSISD